LVEENLRVRRPRIEGVGIQAEPWAAPAARRALDGGHTGFGARKSRIWPGTRGLRGEWLCSMSLVAVQCERVDGQGEAEEVEVLAGVADAVGAAEPHGVVEMPVDRLGVVATRKESLEVGVAGRDGPEVLGAVELPRRVFVVAVEPDRDGLVFVLSGQLVVVV